jgi:hypothetical protein
MHIRLIEEALLSSMFTVCSSPLVNAKMAIPLGNLLPLDNKLQKLYTFFRCFDKLRKVTGSFVISNLIEFIPLCYGTTQCLKWQQGITPTGQIFMTFYI